MRLVMELGKFLGRDFYSFRKLGDGVEFDTREDRFAIFSFFKKSDGVVGVGVQGEFLERAKGEEGEHVTAGERGDECLFWVREVRVS